MKLKFLSFSMFLIFSFCVFCFGCGDSSENTNTVVNDSLTKVSSHEISMFDNDQEKLIAAILNQKFYYENEPLIEMTKSVNLRSGESLAEKLQPGAKRIFYSGEDLPIYSKKVLYEMEKNQFAFLGLCGYANYEDIKKIAAKFTDLPEKTTYTITKGKSTTGKDSMEYEHYLINSKQPDIITLHSNIANNIYDDLSKEFKIELDRNKNFDENLIELANKSTVEQVQKYGKIVVKTYMEHLNGDLPYKNVSEDMYIREGSKKNKNDKKTHYYVPHGFNLYSIGSIKTDIFSHFIKGSEGSFNILPNQTDIKNSREYMKDNYKVYGDVANRVRKVATLKLDQFVDSTNGFVSIRDEKTLNELFDQMDKFDEEYYPLLFAAANDVNVMREYDPIRREIGEEIEKFYKDVDNYVYDHKNFRKAEKWIERSKALVDKIKFHRDKLQSIDFADKDLKNDCMTVWNLYLEYAEGCYEGIKTSYDGGEHSPGFKRAFKAYLEISSANEKVRYVF